MRLLPALTLAIALCAAATMASAAEPQTEEQKALYALGVAMSQNITTFELTAAELEFVTVAMRWPWAFCRGFELRSPGFPGARS